MTTKPRTKWSSAYPAGSLRPHKSKREAYDQVAIDKADGASRTTVWFDEGMGRGWQKFEVIDHAELLRR